MLKELILVVVIFGGLAALGLALESRRTPLESVMLLGSD